jgi:hypothetical protein
MNNSQVKRKLHFENDKDKIQEDSTLELINSEKRKKQGTLSISYVLHSKQQLSLICLTYNPSEEKDGNEVLKKKETIPNDDL